jgi:hypothetical protein
VNGIPLSWWSAADLLAHEDGEDEPVVFEPIGRPSSLKGRAIPKRDARKPAEIRNANEEKSSDE